MSRTAPPEAILRAAGPLSGEHSVPGDKSISHRAAILGAAALGTTRIVNFATNRDCEATLECVKALGARARIESDAIHLDGTGMAGLAPSGVLDARNSGTTIRLLTGLLAGVDVRSELTGDESLRSRPMERVARPLRAMGADVVTTDGHAPIFVRGRSPLAAVEHEPEQPSAQVKSAVLLAGLAANGRTRVVERVRTRDHTERMLAAFGAAAGDDERGAWIEGPAALASTEVVVPGDISSAVFLAAMAILLEGSDATLAGVGLNPTRTRVLDVLAGLGADLEIANTRVSGGEPAGDLRVRYSDRFGRRGPLELGAADVAEMIDEIPILAVLATRIDGGVRIAGASELRKKESDRIAAVAEGLERMGARVAVAEDGLAVEGPVTLHGARIRTFGDHRIAMAFSCAALAAEGETVVEDAAVAGVSFPEFYDHLPRGAVRWNVDVHA